MTNQNLGDAQAGPLRHSRRGEPSFTAYQQAPPRTHKASNVGTTPFHNVSFLFAYPNPGRFTPGRVPEGLRLQADHGQRARARLAAHARARPDRGGDHASGAGFADRARSGEIAESVPGQPDRGMMLKNGDYFWQDAGVTRAVRNIGTTRVEYLEFELK